MAAFRFVFQSIVRLFEFIVRLISDTHTHSLCDTHIHTHTHTHTHKHTQTHTHTGAIGVLQFDNVGQLLVHRILRLREREREKERVRERKSEREHKAGRKGGREEGMKGFKEAKTKTKKH